ncbi:hypothetical protein EF910_05560 [Streptomyces sp. WAC07149]|uniref:hypothetical protein n=1 Tax=Streptomyces sp. WAC07149 TaxID=2487425 RepID=UPI000F78E1A9|nr:hypothetical protein [Streptomyces sp. WAC07149]RST07904.1 hypothetical protein EF910_05560 [Streptomyces sp. WAC07149]
MSMKRRIIAGAGVAVLALGLSGAAVSAQADSRDDANAIAVEVVNESLGGAFDRIGYAVWRSCGEGHDACSAILREVNSMGLNYGGAKYPITFYEDGSWSIGGDGN